MRVPGDARNRFIARVALKRASRGPRAADRAITASAETAQSRIVHLKAYTNACRMRAQSAIASSWPGPT